MSLTIVDNNFLAFSFMLSRSVIDAVFEDACRKLCWLELSTSFNPSSQHFLQVEQLFELIRNDKFYASLNT